MSSSVCELVVRVRAGTWLRVGFWSAERWVKRKKQRRSWLLVEVEVVDEVAEDLDVFAHVGSRVRSAVGARIEPLAVQEVVLDELEVGVRTQYLVIDVALSRERADHE